MKILEIITKPEKLPLYLTPRAPGKRKDFGSRHDFEAALMAFPEKCTKRSGKPEAKDYWVNKKGQVQAVWYQQDRIGIIYGD